MVQNQSHPPAPGHGGDEALEEVSEENVAISQGEKSPAFLTQCERSSKYPIIRINVVRKIRRKTAPGRSQVFQENKSSLGAILLACLAF